MAGTTVTRASDYLGGLAALLGRIDGAAIDAYAEMLFEAWRDRRKVLVFGNGGSAYNASHHVTDYVKTAAVEGQCKLFALSMTDNVGMTTAVGNDLAYDQTFSYPLECLGAAGDVAVGISCSGNSPNLLRACRWAKENGLRVVALTGFEGGKVKEYADLHINVPSDNYGMIEDVHMSVGHIAAQMLHNRITAGGGGQARANGKAEARRS
jgi:D-sedoheptulose 7-phosphate isomerase